MLSHLVHAHVGDQLVFKRSTCCARYNTDVYRYKQLVEE